MRQGASGQLLLTGDFTHYALTGVGPENVTRGSMREITIFRQLTASDYLLVVCIVLRTARRAGA